MSDEITPWHPGPAVKIPAKAKTASDIAQYARQLTPREVDQIIQAFKNGNYEMAASFLWSKTMAGLKKQLASLGMEFVGEMLDRPDISRSDSAVQVLTDYDAVRLATELGMFTPTEAMRLRQVLEIVAHFSEPPTEEEDQSERQMMPEEAMQCLRTCVQNVLSQERLDAPIRFAEFSRRLEEEPFIETDPQIANLRNSPYFFQRTTLRVLLALVKTAHGAQLENGLANANLIIPLLWPNLLRPDRWTIGRVYSEVYSEGKSTAADGLRRILLKVKGFDYVPEDLRSRTFISAASELKSVHFSIDNFYSEPKAIETLEALGSVIPDPAMAQCVSAVLCVRLGNYYGISWAAQTAAESLLQRLGERGWKYYLDDCLPGDEIILSKLQDRNPASRWQIVVIENNLANLKVNNRAIQKLINAGEKNKTQDVIRIARGLFHELTKE